MSRRKSLTLMLCALVGSATARASSPAALLTGSAVTVASGNVASLDISLNGLAGPASLQWTLTYDPSAVSALSVNPGPALAAAGKTFLCSASAGSYQCLGFGLDNLPIPDGVVATVTVVPAISTGPLPLGIASPVAASPGATPIPIQAVPGAVTVFAMPSLLSLSCDASSIVTPGSANCTATLSGPAPPGGLTVAVTGNSSSVSVPPVVTVPPGSIAAGFTATASSVAANQSVTVTAAFNGASMAVPLSLTPPPPPIVPASLACAPSSLVPGESTTCTLILSGLAPPGGSAVALTSASAGLVAPAVVTVPAGATSVIFTAMATTVAATQTEPLLASLGGGSTSVSLVLNPPPGPPLLPVGPGQMFSLPCQALTGAPDGATVQIDASGTYTGDVCTVTASNLTVKGINGRPLINAAGLNSGGQAAWVFQGNNITLDTVELTGAAGPNNNAAGVFMAGNNLTILNSYLHDNQEGLVTAASPNSQILIQSTEFNHNGFGDSLTHNLDIADAARFTVQYSDSHNANAGDLVKSQASENYLLYNRLTSEQGSTAAEIDLPSGGRSFLIGNLIEKGPADLGGDLVAYLAGGPGTSSTELYVVNNTFVNDKSANANFLNIGAGDPAPAVVTNNIFWGTGVVSTQPGSVLSANLTGNPLFVNQAGYDYHLSAGSPAIDSGVTPGPADGVALLPAYEYRDPDCGESRNQAGAPDIGAYEFGGAGTPLPCAASVSGIALNPNTVTGGAAAAATITVSVPAMSSGTEVSLASSNSAVAAVPATVTVPSGATSAMFTVTTSPVAASTPVTISATYSAGTQSAVLTVLAPPALSDFQCAPDTLPSGGVSTCTVSLLAPAPASGLIVNLSAGGSSLSVPGTVTIPPGAASVTFNATAGTVASNQSVSLSATLAATSQSVRLALLGLPGAPTNPSPAPGAAAVAQSAVLAWLGGANATSFDVYFGTASAPSLIATVTASGFSPGSLTASTTYYWKIVANGPGGSTSSPVWSFTTAAPAPVAGVPASLSVSPSSGSGASATFVFTYTDSAGFQSLQGVHAWIISAPNVYTSACWIYYEAASNLLWLSSDDTSTWSSTAVGSGGTVQNSQCQITGTAVSVAGSGANLVLTVPIAFSTSFAGAKIVSSNALDVSGATSPVVPLGSWTVPAAVLLGPVSATPSSGAGSSQLFTLVFADPNGYQSIGGAHVMIGGTTGCWLYYDPSVNQLWLASDDASTWSNAALGTGGTLQNSDCSVNASGASVSGLGPYLTLQLPIAFTANFSGSQPVWLNMTDESGTWTPYAQEGTWTVP